MSDGDRKARIFGTDGIRGRAGEGWLSEDAVSALGRSVGAVLDGSRGATSGIRHALVGHDGRRSGPLLEAALARGLAASGIESTSVGLITTPGLAILARTQDFGLGVMISASHNPSSDNGIKVFDSRGEKLKDAMEDEIEVHLRACLDPVREGSPPTVNHDLELHYLEELLSRSGAPDLTGMSIVLDCANGGGSRIGPRALGRLGAIIRTIASEPDGENINARCGSTHPALLQETVRSEHADLGIALDGDGDRCMLVDERGELINGDGILTLLAHHAKRTGALTDPRIVATVMSNHGLHRALREEGIGVHTVDVGDRQVVEALRAESLQLGGEQSGHIVFGSDFHYIGDGMFTALRALAVMCSADTPLSELVRSYQPFPQVLINVPVARKPSLADIPAVAECVRSAEETLGEDGRILLRYSGTEPLARVMVEGPDADWIHTKAKEIGHLIEQATSDDSA